MEFFTPKFDENGHREIGNEAIRYQLNIEKEKVVELVRLITKVYHMIGDNKIKLSIQKELAKLTEVTEGL